MKRTRAVLTLQESRAPLLQPVCGTTEKVGVTLLLNVEVSSAGTSAS